jgi:hypothetical protein
MMVRCKQALLVRPLLAVSMSFLALLLIPVVLGHGEDMKMENYRVEIETNPAEVSAGDAFTLTVRILNSADSTPVAEFDEVHTKLLHLIAVSEDLTEFLHLHPDYRGDGLFVLENATLPEAANYILFADFTPRGVEQQIVRLGFSTVDAQANEAELTVSEPDVTISPIHFELELSSDLKTHEETSLRFHVTDAVTGEAIDTLDEYLGAAGHLVIIDEAGEIYLHTHPASHEMAGMQMQMSYGPDIEFMTEFPITGRYAMWLQVQYEGEIYTAPFVIDVAHEADAMATQEVHDH